ncbi:tetratricopeptide repeat protein [Kibdelosporangium aridum]|uniref:tetratricopeptide repeat protein n=1 Tax=Kibdelosporangium aridum TaxID=2030 RepID=UPI0035EC2885
MAVTDDGGSRPPNQSRTPFQTPAPPPHFVGRDRELADLARWVTSEPRGPRTIVLSGPAGVGKTALALQWVATLRETYVDGLLFADLGRGSLGPVTPSDTLEGFLLALGVEGKRIPVDYGQREALYRSVTADLRLVVLLDNAQSATQVRPLLLAGEHSVVVVTSRFRLSGLALDGAQWLDVNPLDVAQSLAVLRRMAGDKRVDAESDSAHELAVLCGGLPLALTIVGARLATRPKRRLANEAANLRVENRRLAELALAGAASIEAVFDVSYLDLSEDAALAYRSCAWHPGPDFGIGVAAAMLGWGERRAESALDALLEANFLVEIDDRRFTYHDLLRVHARQHAEEAERSDLRQITLRRAIEWYLDQVMSAELAIHPHRPRVSDRFVTATDDRFDSEQNALLWLESHRVHLTSAVEIAANGAWHELVWQLCEALWGFFLHTRHYRDWIRLHQLGITAAQHDAARRAEARMRSQLGFAYAKLRRYDEAIAENTLALRLSEQEGDIQGMATATSQLGRAAREVGELSEALRYYDQARQLQQEIGQWRGVALCRRRIGQILSKLGRHDEARHELIAAGATMRDLGDTTQHARTLSALAEAHIRAGKPELARPCLHEALSLMRDFGSPYYQAEILAQIGDLARQQGDTESAMDSYRVAAELYAAVGDPNADVMRAHLTALIDE